MSEPAPVSPQPTTPQNPQDFHRQLGHVVEQSTGGISPVLQSVGGGVFWGAVSAGVGRLLGWGASKLLKLEDKNTKRFSDVLMVLMGLLGGAVSAIRNYNRSRTSLTNAENAVASAITLSQERHNISEMMGQYEQVLASQQEQISAANEHLSAQQQSPEQAPQQSEPHQDMVQAAGNLAAKEAAPEKPLPHHDVSTEEALVAHQGESSPLDPARFARTAATHGDAVKAQKEKQADQQPAVAAH